MLLLRPAICTFFLVFLIQPKLQAAEVAFTLQADYDEVRLRLLELEILEREKRIYELKESARIAAEIAPQDPTVLGYLARSSDAFGDHAAEAYQRWTDALLRTEAPEQVVQQALERGVVVALRERDRERALYMSKKLASGSRYSNLASAGKPVSTTATVLVPGGTNGLAHAVEIDQSVPPERFLTEYARAILRRNNSGAAGKLFEGRLKRYFEVVQALEGYGEPGNNVTEITLDVTSSQGLERTEKVLSLMGWQLRKSREGAVLLEVRTGAENGERQEFVSGFGIDEAEMKLTLEARKTFVILIRREPVPVILDPSYWNRLAKRNGASRGLIEDMLNNSRLAGLYVALSNMKDETQRSIVDAMQDDLLDRTRQLSFYGASISIENGRLMLPGGTDAAMAWAKLAEAEPTQLGTFLNNLTKKDGGKLLAYYNTLAALPLQNQRFFTRTVERLSRFYNVFPFSDEQSLESSAFVRKEDQFVRLARELPLDKDGSVLFPGSERVWMILRGGTENVSDVQKLIQRANRFRTPDAEDEILLDMLDRYYDAGFSRKFSLIQNFLAVVRIDAHRHQPMDETMALTLAQNYAKYQSAFPYFAEFTELTGSQTAAFFQAAKRLEGFEGVELNIALGEFHSLLKLVGLLHAARAVSDSKAAELFGAVCDSFARVKASRDLSTTSFDLLERILGEVEGGAERDADERLVQVFAGPSLDQSFISKGTRSVNLADANARRIREVLRLQAVSPLQALLQTYRAAMRLTQGVDTASVSTIEANLGKLVEVTPSGKEELPNQVAENLFIAKPEELLEIVGKVRKELAKKKPSPQNVSKLAKDLIEELNPFLKTSLVGWVYAYYFSPTDLAVASNPYFMRSHIFSDPLIKDYWPKARFAQSPTGSHLVGGFGQMASAVGGVAATTVESSESFPQGHVASLLLGAVRSIPWNLVADRSIHLAAIRVRLGREFIVHSAFNDRVRRDLAEATRGVLGQTRRHKLLGSVAAADVSYALSLLTASDLFFLADAFIQPLTNEDLSPELLAAYAAERRLVPLEQTNYFGGVHAETGGCTHPHLMNLGPYEDYAEQLLTDPLGERMSDIVLEVIESADRVTLPVGALGMLVDSAVREFFKKTKTTPREDWLTSVQAMSAIDLATFMPLLERR